MKTKSPADNRLSVPYRVLMYIIIAIVLLMMIIPLINVLALSFSTKVGSMSPGIRLWPDKFTVEGYVEVWNRANLYRPFFNSVYVTSMGIIIQMILSSFAGYVLIKKDLPFKKFIVTFIMITMMVPSDLTLISIYSVNKQFNLLNTYTGLILNGLVSGFSILLMRNYFLTVPESLAESANLDNAGELRIFFNIYIPLSLPGLATVSFLEFVTKWNAMMIPVTIITDQNKFTLPVILRSMVFDTTATSGTVFIGPNATSAAIVISIFPLIFLYFFAQRFLITGVTLGATKG